MRQHDPCPRCRCCLLSSQLLCFPSTSQQARWPPHITPNIPQIPLSLKHPSLKTIIALMLTHQEQGHRLWRKTWRNTVSYVTSWSVSQDPEFPVLLHRTQKLTPTKLYFSGNQSFRTLEGRVTASLGKFFQQLNHPCVKKVCLSSLLNLSSLIKMFILFFQTRWPLICTVLSYWRTHFSRLKLEFGTASSGCRNTSLAFTSKEAFAAAAHSLGQQRMSKCPLRLHALR